MKSKFLVAILSVLLSCVGVVAGVGVTTYLNLPKTETLNEEMEADVYYSLNGNSQTSAITAQGVQQATAGAISVHFLELGNKYTGDCTYIKVGENIDILIDCGSKTSSISTVSNYLNQYVTDGSLEYVIVTHAHQDHYAGFATPVKVDSIFDLYDCQNVITFSKTNQKSKTVVAENDLLNLIDSENAGKSTSQGMYDYFLRELKAEQNNGAHIYSATSFRDTFANGIITLDETNDIKLQILDSYYYTHKASTENDYSVCTLLTQGAKKFIFTGDLEADGEEQLVTLNSTYLGQVELYKAGHHGSKTSSTTALLSVIQPKLICVCCCAGSPEYTKTVSNQFPTVDFLTRISPYTTNVYVTTLCEDYDNNKFTSFNGNIVVMSNKEQVISVCCSNNTTILKDTDWFKTNRLTLCQSAGIHASWL